MPCSSDYLAASGQELESVRVCKMLAYLFERLERTAPKWIIKAANDYYGNVARLNEATSLLCEMCRCLSKTQVDQHIYDAHDRNARALADWWERHQEWDRRRVAEEDAARKRATTRERALRKLSVEDMEALGLVDPDPRRCDHGNK